MGTLRAAAAQRAQAPQGNIFASLGRTKSCARGLLLPALMCVHMNFEQYMFYNDRWLGMSCERHRAFMPVVVGKQATNKALINSYKNGERRTDALHTYRSHKIHGSRRLSSIQFTIR